MTWRPETEAELLRALAAGDVAENRFLDVKRQPYTTAERREAARDMASFAINGGAIIFGVAEQSDVMTPSPFELAHQSERIENIAANAIEPALPIRVHPIPAEADDGKGYLYVEIPPSPMAPDMVEHEYWARVEKTKRRMGDAEVVQMHTTRERVEDRIIEALQEERDRQPHPTVPDRLFLVSLPLAAPADVARAFTAGDAYEVVGFSRSVEDSVPASVGYFAPSPHYTNTHERRSRGIAATSFGPGRTTPADDRQPLDIEIQASGSVRILVPDNARAWGRPNSVEPMLLIMDGAVIAWAHRLVRYSELLAERVGYRGPWGFGLYVGGLRGLRGAQQSDPRRFMSTLSIYEADSYQRVTTASLQEMQDSRNLIVGRLAADLALALDSSEAYADALTMPSTPDPEEQAPDELTT